MCGGSPWPGAGGPRRIGTRGEVGRARLGPPDHLDQFGELPLGDLLTPERPEEKRQARHDVPLTENLGWQFPPGHPRKVKEQIPGVPPSANPERLSVFSEFGLRLGRREKPTLELADVSRVVPVGLAELP